MVTYKVETLVLIVQSYPLQPVIFCHVGRTVAFMKKKKKNLILYGKRLFCCVLVAMLMFSIPFSSYASGSIYDPMYPENNGEIGSYVYPDQTNGKAYFMLRRGINYYLKLNSQFRSQFPGGYSGSYPGIGTGDVKSEVYTPLTASNYTQFKNTIITQRFTFEFPYQDNFDSKVSGVVLYDSYNKDTIYPLCTGISIPFSFYGFSFTWSDSDKNPILDLCHKFYGADIYCQTYSVDYEENGEEILLSKWTKTSYDVSILKEIKNRDNPYFNDDLVFANSASFDLSFDRPVLLAKIVIDFRIKVSSAYSTYIYPELSQYAQDEVANCRSLIVFPSFFTLVGYGVSYNYSLFNSMGLAEDISGSVYDSFDLVDALNKYSSKPYDSLSNVVNDAQGAFSLIGNIVTSLYANKVISGIVIVSCALAVLAAFVALGLRFVNFESSERRRIKNRDEARDFSEKRYIRHRDENRRYNEEKWRRRNRRSD